MKTHLQAKTRLQGPQDLHNRLAQLPKAGAVRPANGRVSSPERRPLPGGRAQDATIAFRLPPSRFGAQLVLALCTFILKKL